MFIEYFTIAIFLGTFVKALADVPKDTNAVVVDLEAKRLANSQLIRKYMNESVDPCDDFYQFACGNYPTHHPATRTNPHIHGYSIVAGEFYVDLIKLIQKDDEKFVESELKVRQFLDSCKQLKSPTKLRQRIKQIVNKELGGMPALMGNKWQAKKFDWIKTVGKISHNYGIQIIYGYSIGSINGPNELYMRSKLLWAAEGRSVVDKVNEVRNNLERHLGLNNLMAKKTAKEIVDFEERLRKASELEVDDNDDDDDDETTIEAMAKKYKRHLDIRKLVKAAFGYIPAGSVIEVNPKYVPALSIIMKKSWKRVQANYVIYAFLNEFYFPMLNGGCFGLLKSTFVPLLSKMLYRRSKVQEAEQAVEQIFKRLNKALQSVLESNELQWFDDSTREAALEKLHILNFYIGSYKEVDFDEMYKGLTMSSSDIVMNRKALMKLKASQMRRSLNEHVEMKHITVIEGTPDNVMQGNVIRYPLGLLTSEFMWSKYFPNAVNYGRLGVTIGHEIMHTVSADGLFFDKLGNQIEWLSEDIDQTYDDRIKCYYDQYHNLTLAGKRLNQASNQAENIADNGGLYLAYQAYLTWLQEDARTQAELDMETLPQMNYTNKQLFFIGFSQKFCTSIHPDKIPALANDEHSPNQFRAFVPLQNFGEFSKEFNCPLGSQMNPRKKCSIY